MQPPGPLGAGEASQGPSAVVSIAERRRQAIWEQKWAAWQKRCSDESEAEAAIHWDAERVGDPEELRFESRYFTISAKHLGLGKIAIQSAIDLLQQIRARLNDSTDGGIIDAIVPDRSHDGRAGEGDATSKDIKEQATIKPIRHPCVTLVAKNPVRRRQ